MKVSGTWVRWTAFAVLGSIGGCAVDAGQQSEEPGAAQEVAEKSLALGESTVALNASADTAVSVSGQNQNFGTSAVLDVNRTLVKFDPAALRAAVGPTDYLVGARLELTLTRNSLRSGAPARAVTAFKLNKAWTESGATWNCAIDSDPSNKRADCSGQATWSMGVLPPNPWTTPASASATVAPLQTGAVGFDVTADVRGFLGAAGANQGWLLMSGPLGAIADFADFGSRETVKPPRLVLSVRRCSASLCDDGLACTVDSCSAVGECVHVASPNGTACSDGNACTAGDACVAGACSPGAEDLCAPPPAVVVNEAESNQGVPGDWIELYNKGTTDADLSGFVVKDNDDTHNYTIPTGTIVAAGGYLVIDEMPLGFGLGAADSARLFDKKGNLIDSQSWTAHAATTYGLCPNGAGTWKVTTTVTKGGPNDCSAPLPQVVVNEAESNQGSPGDWIELFNKGTTPADLSGFVLKDNDDTHAYTIPAGTVVAAGGYLVVDEMPLGFGLGSADSARLFTSDGVLVSGQSWTAHAATTYGLCPNGTGTWKVTTSPTKGTANDCGVATPQVVVNEAESNQGVPGDWIELLNKGTSAADLSGFIVKDNDDTHIYTIPANTVVAPGGYLVVDEVPLGFGLGSADSARLFTPEGVLVDGQSWTAHATTTYGLCPNGTGAWTTMVSVTKGAENDCGGIRFTAWPGRNAVVTVDPAGTYSSNLSGLTYQPATATEPAVLWAVQNSPAQLYKLVFDGTNWVSSTDGDWVGGKQLVYPDGTGVPDCEGLTLTAYGDGTMYVATERNNSANSISRLSILRFDITASGDVLTATYEWNLNTDLPVVGANLGLEAITYIDDEYLVGNGFIDESTGLAYDPLQYADHGAGVFFVGVEASGLIYGVVLDHATTNGYEIVATIESGHVGVMGMEFDRDLGGLWAYCDNTCNNRSTVLAIETDPTSPKFGKFVVQVAFNAPSTLPADMNNEGIAIAPESECVDGQKAFFWSDDGSTGGHAIRQDTIPCAPLF